MKNLRFCERDEHKKKKYSHCGLWLSVYIYNIEFLNEFVQKIPKIVYNFMKNFFVIIKTNR